MDRKGRLGWVISIEGNGYFLSKITAEERPICMIQWLIPKESTAIYEIDRALYFKKLYEEYKREI